MLVQHIPKGYLGVIEESGKWEDVQTTVTVSGFWR